MIWVGNGSNTAAAVSISNDATLSNTGALTISNDAITSAKILNGTIMDADINSSAGIAITKISGGSNIITSLATPSGSSANGGSISSNVLTLSLADITNPGLTSAATQTFGGNKTFNNDLSVNGNSILGNASTDTVTLNGSTVYIPNGLDFSSDGVTPYSVLKIQNRTQVFGGLVESGGFFGNNSYFSEEFNADTSNAITADSAVIGDNGQMYFDTTSNNVSYTAFDGIGGFARLTFGTTSNTGALIGFGAAGNALSSIFSKASLPVVQMKVRTNVTNATNDIVWGLMDRATAAPVANDALPNNGIFFWTNNDASWVGVVRSAGSTVGTVTCSGTISTTAFALGRIQVESSTSVRFLMDYDVSDGINFTDCGTVSGAGPTADLGVALYNMHTETTGSRQIDLDYIRAWQDDSPIARIETRSISNPDAITQYNFNDQLVDGLDLFNGVKTEVPYDAVDKFTFYRDNNMTILPESAIARIYSASISTDGLVASKIGIGTKTSSYRFQVGEKSNYGYVDEFGAWQSSSDERFKENITKIDNALSLVSRMEGIRYNVIGGSAPQIGFSAQKMEQIVPEIVSTDKDGYKGIAYSHLAPILVNAINEQQLEINSLQSQIASLSVPGVSQSDLNDLVVSGAISIGGHVTLDKDSVGEVIVRAGETSASVSFSSAYDFFPIITATSFKEYAPVYVKDITKIGFSVSFGEGYIPQNDVKILWHAFAQREKLFEFDQPASPVVPVSSAPSVTEESVTPPESGAVESSSSDAPIVDEKLDSPQPSEADNPGPESETSPVEPSESGTLSEGESQIAPEPTPLPEVIPSTSPVENIDPVVPQPQGEAAGSN